MTVKQGTGRDFEVGFLVGILVGEGHFGGDGRQPHVTLRMHTDHKTLFDWIMENFPGGKLYGPYRHGGRQYYQWMARGAFLREQLVPLLDRYLDEHLDAKSARRFQAMKARYFTASDSAAGAAGAAPASEEARDR